MPPEEVTLVEIDDNEGQTTTGSDTGSSSTTESNAGLSPTTHQDSDSQEWLNRTAAEKRAARQNIQELVKLHTDHGNGD